MGLIVQRKKSLIGGVSQQGDTLRLNNQVTEMINCIPSIDKGLVKRNPTDKLKLKYNDGSEASIKYSLDMWVFEHDRGSGEDEYSEFAIMMSDIGLQIVNVRTGTMYDATKGITYSDNSDDYLLPYNGRIGYAATTIKDTIFISNKSIKPSMIAGTPDLSYKRNGFVWIKKSEPTTGYKYGCTITLMKPNGVRDIITIPVGSNESDSSAAASDLASRISSDGRVSADANGSIIHIVISSSDYSEIISVDAVDSFGDSASFGWGYKVEAITQLPKNMGGYTSIVKVGTKDNASYWVEHKDGSWVETGKPDMNKEVDATTMPHILVKHIDNNGVLSWEVKQYSWDDRVIGDEKTNAAPQLFDAPIKDLFFFKNRLGLMTSTGVSMSEVGEYGNFFRTSVGAMLDSDRIDFGVESRTSINLEYALLTEDSVVMFSDNAQFRFEGGEVLSPVSFKVSEILSYEVNINVRPLFVNDRIFFVAKRGDYSVVYYMTLSDSSTRSSQAYDITAHVQSYIDDDVDKLSASNVDNMLFITSLRHRDTIYVYKYLESNGEYIQSAWGKWTFSGTIYSAFTIYNRLSVLIHRIHEIAEDEWIMGNGRWNRNEVWINDGLWIMTPQSLTSQNQFEVMDIAPQELREEYLDGGTTNIPAFVNFGRWIYGADGDKDTRAMIQFKTVTFEYDEGSDFELWIYDRNRKTDRIVPFKFIDRRKPSVKGNAKNIELGIKSDNANGFRLTSVSFEGYLSMRAKAK